MTNCVNCNHPYREHPKDENGTYTGCTHKDCNCKYFEMELND
jgi:hypothetical protein